MSVPNNEDAAARDNAAEPLFAESLAGELDESLVASPGPFVWSLTMCAGVSGLLFGYDTGVISSTLVSIGTDLSSRHLTTMDKSLIASCTSLFAFLISPLTGLFADQLGRKPVILVAGILFILGALIQALTASVGGMIVGRSIVGAAVGGASCIAPLYIGELSPSPFRGRMVVISVLFISTGQVLAYVVGWALSETQSGWRWMVGLGAVPAVVQIGLLTLLPETPRWLMKANKVSKAKEVLGRVYGTNKETLVRAIMRRVEREIYEEENVTSHRGISGPETRGWKCKVLAIRHTFTQLTTVGGNRRALIIACFLQGFQQLSGFNSLMYFSATIFAMVGFQSPTLTSLSIASTNLIFTLVAFYYIDRVGRRRILLYSIPVMVLGLTACAAAFGFLDLPAAASRTSIPRAEDVAVGVAWPQVILTSTVLYVAGYAIGIGNVPWQQSELFPLSVRGQGSALATATNWGSNFLVGITFLPSMDVLTPVGTFALYALVCTVAWFVVYKIYPETVGCSLEDVAALLETDWGVAQSVRRLKEGRPKGKVASPRAGHDEEQ
ncbi:general substrate transporter [Westerdykella ornata]|uniref:General substrate transporter n=1 Tax=Westerdykella ornata TaxID=318751 RepID=A0A6A6JWI8_WESOR|nr:general substrate transporter [Westerdykella ornata]KAF2280564.1 general substrate transporter [Westerdykella ornata]